MLQQIKALAAKSNDLVWAEFDPRNPHGGRTFTNICHKHAQGAFPPPLPHSK